MNLVAKEYVAAQDENDPGVLILSQFAGAVAELDGALIVNPHEREAVSAAIERALSMPLDERRARHARMFERIADHDVSRWASSFIQRLAEARNKWSLIDGIRQIFAPRAGDVRAAGRRIG
jgi:trehalose 6-phosphate synthase